jgi:CheY-like chemotaxis protein
MTDTGCGMDEETRSHIFEPFYTTKGSGRGTGLGLSTVYGIVRQSDGAVWVYSEPGKGTTFKIFLPRIDAKAETGAHGPDEGELGGSETILVVEDYDVLKGLAGRILRAAGYTVLEASDGAEALALCKKHNGELDLILADVVMPSMGGRELAERIKRAHPKLKMLFMSGYTDEAITRNGVLPAGVPFLEKPFTALSLKMKAREVLGPNYA